MNWRYLLFIISIAISILSLILYIFFDFPFLFLFFFLPPIFLLGKSNGKTSEFLAKNQCNNCGQIIHEKNYQFCPYCGSKLEKTIKK